MNKRKINQLVDENKSLNERLDILTRRLEELDQKTNEYYWGIRTDLRNQGGFASLEKIVFKSSSRILVAGFYGARNLGDEIMLQSILKIFEEKKIKVTIMLSNNYSLDTSIYYPHDVIHFPAKGMDFSIMANNFDTIIWGGGAVLDDNGYCFDSYNTSLTYALFSISKNIIKKNGNVIVLGVSSNKEFSDPKFIADLDYIVKNSKYFSLRDTFSLEVLKKNKINTDKIEVIDDIALAQLKPLQAKELNEAKKTLGLVFVLTEENLPTIGSYLQKIVQLAKELKKEKGLELNLLIIPFYDADNNDFKFSKKLVEEFISEEDRELISQVESVVNIEELEEVFSQCDVVISMRYHATLIASCLGLKTVLINYDTKHRHYFNKNSFIKQKYNSELIECYFGDEAEKIVHCIKEALADTNIDEKRAKEGESVAKKVSNKIRNILAIAEKP